MNTINGERIGAFKRNSYPRDDSLRAYYRFQALRGLVEAATAKVLEDAGRTGLYSKEKGDDGKIHDVLYTEPPVQDPSEAERLGAEISQSIGQVVSSYPENVLSSEFDPFTPAQAE